MMVVKKLIIKLDLSLQQRDMGILLADILNSSTQRLEQTLKYRNLANSKQRKVKTMMKYNCGSLHLEILQDQLHQLAL